MTLNQISATERRDQKRIPAFLLAASPFLQTSLKKKKKNCLNPLQQHQQGPRNIHTAFFLFLSFSSSIHLTWIPLSLQGLQTNWTNHAKSRGSFKKKKKETNTRWRNEAIRRLAFLIESHLIAAEPAADVRQMSRWVACNNTEFLPWPQ